MTQTHVRPDDALSEEIAADVTTARRWAAGHVIVTVLVALLVGVLLNAQDLLATAERQPFGWQRDMAVALASPVARVSSAIGLDRPRNGIDTALGRTDDGAPVIDDAPDDGGAPVIAVPEEQDSGRPTDPDEPTSTPTPTETEVAGPMGLARGPVTADDPLRLYIAGDSMVEIQFGIALEDLAGDTGMMETLGIDFDRGSGLTRPDYIDWPARLAKASAEVAPDVMVVYFGGNDAQPMELDGAVYDIDTPEWQAEYRTRVADLMDQLTEAGHHVYWMGLPAPSSDTMIPKFTIMNAIYQEEAATRNGVTYQATWDLFVGPDGRYREYLPDEDGNEVDMRLDDGIHLTTAGAYRAARPTIATIAADFDIPLTDD